MEASAAPRLAPVGVSNAKSLRFLRLASDAHLVALIREGRGAAFEAVYDRHHRGILSFCRHMLSDPQEAEDAVQHVFLAAYNDLIASNKQIHLRAWLFAIARNRCYSVLRARREQPAADLDEAVTEGLATQVQRRQDLRDLLGDMQSLPDDQRAALVLAELESLSHEQIGEALGVPREKVKALVFQARESLVASRTARETDCAEIREQLANGRGGTLRRANLRRHLRECAACRDYRTQVEHQRRRLAVLLPVAPTIALKEGVLAGTVGGSAAAGIAGGVVLSSAVKSGGLKAVIGAVVAGVGTAGTIVATHDLQTRSSVLPPTVTQAPSPPPPKVLPAATVESHSSAPTQAQVESIGSHELATAVRGSSGNGGEQMSAPSARPTGGVSFSSTAAASTLRSLIQGAARAIRNLPPIPGTRPTGAAPIALPHVGPTTTRSSTPSHPTGSRGGSDSSAVSRGSWNAPTLPSSTTSGTSNSTGRRSGSGSHGGRDGGYGGTSGSSGHSDGSGGSTRGNNTANGHEPTDSKPADSPSSGSGSGSGSGDGGGPGARGGSGASSGSGAGGSSGASSSGAASIAPSAGGSGSAAGSGSSSGSSTSTGSSIPAGSGTPAGSSTSGASGASSGSGSPSPGGGSSAGAQSTGGSSGSGGAPIAPHPVADTASVTNPGSAAGGGDTSGSGTGGTGGSAKTAASGATDASAPGTTATANPAAGGATSAAGGAHAA